ncbi:MAG: hypothetical protein KGL35_08150, partial [Bradyrhizobium sp.]|nr:hypothetical protein [Bradyrhizobium sp.]
STGCKALLTTGQCFALTQKNACRSKMRPAKLSAASRLAPQRFVSVPGFMIGLNNDWRHALRRDGWNVHQSEPFYRIIAE